MLWHDFNQPPYHRGLKFNDVQALESRFARLCDQAVAHARGNEKHNLALLDRELEDIIMTTWRFAIRNGAHLSLCKNFVAYGLMFGSIDPSVKLVRAREAVQSLYWKLVDHIEAQASASSESTS